MRSKIEIAVPSVLIVIAEGLFFAGYPMACLGVHALNVLVCLLGSVIEKADAPMLQAFSLISLIRLLGLGMPTLFDLTLLNYIPVYVAAIVGAFVLLREGRSLRQFFGLMGDTIKSAWRRIVTRPALIAFLLFFGTLLGYLLANIEFRIIAPQPLVPELTVPYLVLLAFVMFFLIGFGEELIFRYILQGRLQARMGMWPGVVMASFIFAVMHSVYLSPVYLVYVFFVGMILGVGYMYSRSLGFVSLIHGAINFFLFSYLPYGQLHLF
jgi:membrane protease YdiL (CAAX protease family)